MSTNKEGLDQSFNSPTGELTIKDVVSDKDSWILKKGKTEITILTHNGVKKIAKAAGLRPIKYEILTQPHIQNNYQYTIQVTITGPSGEGIGIGETNRGNLGSRGKNNPANMAEKRAFDRAVFDYLGITGLLSEDELPDNEETKVEQLTIEEQKQIVPLINQLLQTKKRADLVKFANEMKNHLTEYNEKQLVYLRGLHRKRLSDLEKTF